MRKCLLSVFMCFPYFMALAQGEGNVWAFGMHAGLNFNGSNPVPILTNMTGYGEGNASICDKNGQLLFYTEGSIIWDRNGDTMPNGHNLTSLSFISEGNGMSFSPTSSCTQGSVIVPMPDSAGKYYVFSLTETEELQNAGRLYYSVVDMSLNGGMGDVEAGRRGVIIDSGLTEKMTIVKGDHCDLWLLTRSLQNAAFKAFEITAGGINFTPVISNIAAFPAGVYQWGTMKVSPNRRKIASGNAEGYGLELCDFDPATGIVSNSLIIDEDPYYGVAFSPDNSILYATEYFNTNTLNQWNISANVPATISASKIVLAGVSGFTDLKLGPDNKIYINPDSPDVGMMVINDPNNIGAACNIGYIAPFASGSSTLYGLPNAIAILVRDTLSPTQQTIKACFKDSITLYANDSGWDYMWDNGSNQTYRTVYSSGNYIVHYHTAPCTYHTDTFRVSFIPVPLTGSLTGCYGQHAGKAWAQPQSGDTSTYTYTWTNVSGMVLQASSTSSIIADTLYNQYPGMYIVNIHQLGGCDTSLSVVIDTPANHGFIKAFDTGMCPHDTITLHATGGASYQWHADSLTYISDTAIADPRVSPQTDWSYIVYGTNSSGCQDTATAHVRVFPNAVIQLPDSVTIYYGESFQFSPPTNCITFHWFPPLGLSADDISNPIATPPVNTKYIVTGTTEEGCITKDSVNMYRSDEVILTLPNAFTPGNGPNNLFIPIYKGDVRLDYLRIYNRWGQLIYESSDLNQGWDGSWLGTPQPKGVYIYTMEGHTSEGRRLAKQGNVTLIR